MRFAIPGIYLLSKNFDDRFAGRTVKFSRFPGMEPNSWSYYGEDGHALSADKSGAQYGPHFGSKLYPSISQFSCLSGCKLEISLVAGLISRHTKPSSPRTVP